ncbi:MAG: sigma factor-like helix-turn-helix DNA-binding protein [Actinomycetota bacterium]
MSCGLSPSLRDGRPARRRDEQRARAPRPCRAPDPSPQPARGDRPGDLHALSYEEIRSITGWRPGTVRSRIHRGRAHLRRHLRPYVEGSDG